MRYLGGKQRISAQLCPVIQKYLGENQPYVEPFVGSAAVISKIQAQTRIGADFNAALITMWKALASGWHPPEELLESTYNEIKHTKDPTNPLTAFAGFGCSFAGKWFGGYAREWDSSRNYAKNAASSLKKKQSGLVGVQWIHCHYSVCPTPERSVIYCDPPYQGKTKYDGTPPFNHEPFWDWCRRKRDQGHTVLISEYQAPEDFELVAEFPTKLDMHSASLTKERRVERLFSGGSAE